MRTSVSLLVMIASIAVSAPALAQDSRVASVFQKHLRAGVTYEAYMSQVLSPFRQGVRDRVVLDQSAIDEAKAVAERRAGQSGLAMYLQMDRNMDGVVTGEEVRLSLEEQLSPQGGMDNASRLAQIERRFVELMRADTNGNASVELHEMRAAGMSQAGRNVAQNPLSEYLALSPSTGKLTAKELVRMARAAFETADTDGDTILSVDEARQAAVRQTTVRPGPTQNPLAGQPDRLTPEQRNPVRQVEKTVGCEIPAPANADRIVVFGAYEGTGQSSVALGDLNNETRTATVAVEPGEEPLYLVLSTFRPMVWRFTGAVDRVSRVVLTASHGPNGTLPVGVTGVSKDKVVFTHPGACIRNLYKVDTVEGAVAKGVLTRLLGRSPDVMAGNYAIQGVSVPSMTLAQPARTDRPSVPDGVPAQEWNDALRFTPTGIVAINPKDVVWSGGKAESYDVLPGRMGVAQLVGKGDLKALGGEQYKIVRPIPRFPADLTGAHSVKFLLATGVPMPAGSPGHSCVISEETGLPIGQSITCR